MIKNRKNSRGRGLLALLLIWVMPSIASENSIEDSIEGKYKAIEYHLDNGFRVVFVPDDKANQVGINLVYFTGSMEDPQRKSGLAHMVEHLTFNARTQQGDASLVSEMTRRNIGFNATTSYDRTLYMAAFSPDQQTLNWLVQEEAARMRYLAISQDDIKRELAVVLREKEIGDSNQAQQLTQKMLSVAADFPAYSRSPIGATDDLTSLTVADTKAFYQAYYRPDNALLVVTGRFDPEMTLKQVQSSFGSIVVESELSINDRPDTAAFLENTSNVAQQQTDFTAKGDSPLFALMYPLPGEPTPHTAAVLSLLSQVLAGSPASRLHQGLVASVQSVGVMTIPLLLRDAGVFQVVVVPSGSSDDAMTQAREKLNSLLNEIKIKPITTEEIERAKTILKNAKQQVLSNPAMLGQSLAENAAVADWRLYFDTFDQVEALTASAVQAAALRYLDNSKVVTGTVLATDKTLASHRDVQEETAANPKETTAAPSQVADGIITSNTKIATDGDDLLAKQIDAKIDRFSINNSLAVALWPKEISGDRVQGVWHLRMGTAESLFGKRILAEVTGFMLGYGSQSMNQQALFDRVNQLGASLSIRPHDDRLTISFDAPVKSLAALLDIIVTTLRGPALPPEALKEVVNQLTASYQYAASQPSVLAKEAMTAAMSSFPVGDVRREPSVKEAFASLKAIRHQDVVDFHAAFYGANGQLMLTGDFDPQVVREQLMTLLGSWKSRVSYQRPPVPFVAIKPGKQLINTQNKAHGIYIAKQRLPLGRQSNDALALKLANHVLGFGTLQSRLGKRLRKDEGISYSIGSKMGFSYFEPRGTFIISATYLPDQREQFASAVRDELNLLVKEGITEAELRAAKDNWFNRNDLSQFKNSRPFGKLNLLLRLDRNMQFYARENTQIAELTSEQVNAVITRYIKPDQLVEVFADNVSSQGNPVKMVKSD